MAFKLAGQGLRTLVISTDAAHSLADVIGYLNRIRHIVFGGS
ncbi:ArsA-related P-loop ATPase [Paenibacillus sp. V4I5]|nr:anion-transporting ArsA/GET3 family ATPase [Paenibacillus sp. V4I5]